MFQIEIPKGISLEISLSLQYSEGTSNSFIGFSWVLGGVSNIYLGAPKCMYDKLNQTPPDYDSTKPKLIID